MTRLVILFLLWVGITVSTEVDLQKRIIGGQPCSHYERHYHVKLSADPTGRELLCGGSLISDQWIITAAHCCNSKLYAVLSVHPGPVEITAPPVIFKDKDNNKVRTHDIMLLKLPSTANITIHPVGFPDCKNRPKINDIVQVAGHAATSARPNNEKQIGMSETLQCADLKVVDCEGLRNTMKKEDPDFYLRGLYEQWFCGQATGVDTCGGDSGGGVVYHNMLYGVHSFTGDTQYACTAPSGFIDICPYIHWIRQQMTTDDQTTPSPNKSLQCE